MDRTAQLREWLNREHFRYRAGAGALGDRVHIRGAKCFSDFKPGRVFEIGLAQFQTFLQTCLGLPPEGDGTVWEFTLDPSGSAPGFVAEIAAERVCISGRTENDLTDAMHYLEREMVDHGGPWLPPGTLERHPALGTRFTEGVFIPGHQSADNPGDFSDDYLGLMRHYGYNALKICLSLKDLWHSTSLPELNSPNLDGSFEQLQRHAARLKDHGMDLFAVLMADTHPSTHAVFQNHPEILGAREEIFLEELTGSDRCVLCADHPLVGRAYGEAVENLFRKVPALAGGILVVGGEGFRHCFMRPASTAAGGTNCPRCAGQDPHAHVARLVNTVAAAIKAVGSGKRILAWPYSAFVWSTDDPTDSRWIRSLDPGVEVLSNFDCGDVDPTTDAGVVLYDYNIKITGPSSRFAAQARLCHSQSRPILAKTETNTTPDSFFLPYLPVHFRWHARFRAIQEAGCAGFMGQWRFFGMNGSPPEELQYHSVWNPGRTAEELLQTIARRDYGLGAEQAKDLVEAWRILGRAWDAFPYSAMTAGEREGYMRGPWYLGPAHPLIFNSQNHYSLGQKFFLLRGDLAEMLEQDEISRTPGKPRYVSDLLLCLPFGVREYLQLARSCRDQWDQGLGQMEAILETCKSPAALRELDICRAVSVHLHSLANTVEFLELRDLLGHAPLNRSEFEEHLEKLGAVVGREIGNARRALPGLRRDPRIGYGFTYGEVYDAEMVEDKIRQCEFLRDQELPRIGSVIRFHVWHRYP